MARYWASGILAALVVRQAAAASSSIIAPSGTLSTILPRATDTNFGPFISDSGAGGFVSKWNMSLFAISDGSLCNDTSLNSTCYFPSVHTGYAAIDPSNPSNLIIIGDYYNTSGKNFLKGRPDFWRGPGGQAGLVPYNATADSKFGITADGGFAPAPHVAPIPIPGNDTGLLNVWPVHPNEKAYQYNTMFEMNFFANQDYLNNPLRQQVPVVRTNPVLFNVSNGNGLAGYGSAMLTSGRGSEASTNFYLWEGDPTGWKLARAPWASRTDPTTYDYWHGSAGWVHNAPLRYGKDAYGNVANLTYSGLGVWGQDIRWVDRFQTYVITFQPVPGAPGTVFLQYSLTGQITGPYSDAKAILSIPWDDGCKVGNNGNGGLTNFATFHWDYYGLNADHVLVSWVSCTRFQDMAILKWTNGYTV